MRLLTSSTFLLLLSASAYLVQLTSGRLTQVHVKRDSIPNPWECSVVSILPDGPRHYWWRFNQAIKSGQIIKTLTDGTKRRISEVFQVLRVTNKEPHRTFTASLEDDNYFYINEFWTYKGNWQPTLSHSYYTIVFTDAQGHNPTKQMVISMPPQYNTQSKFCRIGVDQITPSRTFTLNMYVEPLHL